MSISNNSSVDRVYYGYTTYQQRKLMIEVYEETSNISEACRRAKVSRTTFKRWYPRYKAGGFDGLKEFESRAPKNPCRVPVEYANRAIALKQAHPDWGKQRIADEICKENGWQKLIGKKGVKNVLERAGLWDSSIGVNKKKETSKRRDSFGDTG